MLTFVEARLGRRLPETFQWNIVSVLHGHVLLPGLQFELFRLLTQLAMLVFVVLPEQPVENAPFLMLTFGGPLI